uniref:RRM domain-containing protein n=1 Tax=Macrostomum lignano TaxID=282301 RepID=A0A1I8FGL6_9PLAT
PDRRPAQRRSPRPRFECASTETWRCCATGAPGPALHRGVQGHPARDYLAVAAACTAEAEEFLARLDGSGQQLIRMRGLPYVVTAEQVLEFFDKSSCPVQFGRDGLLFAQRADGRATGDAFALFASSERAERALERGHRQHIGSRYVNCSNQPRLSSTRCWAAFNNNSSSS